MTATAAPALAHRSPTPRPRSSTSSRDLIRIDTSNYGDGTGPGEAEAAEYVEARLREVGLDPERSPAVPPVATAVVVRIPGRDRSRGALLRARPPRRRAGAGARTGRYAAVRRRGRRRPRRTDDLGSRRGRHEGHGRHGAGGRPRVGAHRCAARARHRARRSSPDEEAGGQLGSHWLVEHRPGPVRGLSPRRSARSAASR